MELDFKGKKALVTGGSRGIGRSIVLALARSGASVTTCYAHEGAAVEALAGEIDDEGLDVTLVRADITNEADIARLVDGVGDRFGSLDVLVNNAGVISHAPLHEVSLEEWHRVLDTNLTGSFLIYKATRSLLVRGSSIVSIGSAGSLRGAAERTHYMTSKAGILGLTRSLARELGPLGIRINTVAAGYTDTDRMTNIPPERRAKISSTIALGRPGHPDEVAAAALFLASDAASYITGSILTVDGAVQ